MSYIPKQQRSVDPYERDRFSSAINRYSRIITAGKNVILHANESFLVTMNPNDTTNSIVDISPGLCVKDDVTIHVTEKYPIDFNIEGFYDGESKGLNSDGDYIIALKYNYARTVPAPKAEYRIVKNYNYFITHQINYLYISSVRVELVGGTYEIVNINNVHPQGLSRNDVLFGVPTVIDGGFIT